MISYLHFLSLLERKPNQTLETADPLEEGEIPEEEIDDEDQSDSTHVQEPISTLPGQPIEAKFMDSKNRDGLRHENLGPKSMKICRWRFKILSRI